MKSLTSHAGVTLSRQLGRGVLSSHAGNAATEATLAVA
jgi:hypothetical protein